MKITPWLPLVCASIITLASQSSFARDPACAGLDDNGCYILSGKILKSGDAKRSQLIVEDLCTRGMGYACEAAGEVAVGLKEYEKAKRYLQEPCQTGNAIACYSFAFAQLLSGESYEAVLPLLSAACKASIKDSCLKLEKIKMLADAEASLRKLCAHGDSPSCQRISKIDAERAIKRQPASN